MSSIQIMFKACGVRPEGGQDPIRNSWGTIKYCPNWSSFLLMTASLILNRLLITLQLWTIMPLVELFQIFKHFGSLFIFQNRQIRFMIFVCFVVCWHRPKIQILGENSSRKIWEGEWAITTDFIGVHSPTTIKL